MGTTKRTGVRFLLVALAVLFVTCLVLLAGLRLITGQSLELRDLASNGIGSVTNTVELATRGRAVLEDSRGSYNNIIFLHHSTGNGLVNHGKLHELFAQQNYKFYDHGFNRQGLRAPVDNPLRYHYNVPGDNTDPDGLIAIFRQPLLPLPVNTFSALMQHEVIVIKSCFEPGNNITSDAQVKQYQDWYVEMRGVMQAHPEKVFIMLTIPPLNPAETNAEEAERARTFATWLSSAEFLAESENIAVFDLYGQLAENDPAAPDYNMLRADYRTGSDSHPIRAANEVVAPQFAAFIMETAAQYRGAVAGK